MVYTFNTAASWYAVIACVGRCVVISCEKYAVQSEHASSHLGIPLTNYSSRSFCLSTPEYVSFASLAAFAVTAAQYDGYVNCKREVERQSKYNADVGSAVQLQTSASTRGSFLICFHWLLHSTTLSRAWEASRWAIKPRVASSLRLRTSPPFHRQPSPLLSLSPHIHTATAHHYPPTV